MKRYTTGIGDNMNLPPGGGFYSAPEVDAELAARDKRIAELEAMVKRLFNVFLVDSADSFAREDFVALKEETRALLAKAGAE